VEFAEPGAKRAGRGTGVPAHYTLALACPQPGPRRWTTDRTSRGPIRAEKVISGGQTGADQGGLRAAKAAGIPTGGWAPRGWLVESPHGHRDIAAPWLGPVFRLVECAELGYPALSSPGARSHGSIHPRKIKSSLRP
jgi:hypothetical protein